MPKLLSRKAGKLSIGDALMIAGAKSLGERVLTPIIGNGTLISGGIKIVGAILSNQMLGGKIGDILGTSLMVDGAEDLVTAFLGGGGTSNLFGGGSAQVEVI